MKARLCFILYNLWKIEKERNGNEKGTRARFWKKGTKQERVPQNQQRNEEGTRSSKIWKLEFLEENIIGQKHFLSANKTEYKLLNLRTYSSTTKKVCLTYIMHKQD